MLKLYALHDKKAESFSSFHVEKSDAVATRHFADAVLKGDSMLGRYPDDFELVALAQVFEDSTAFDYVFPLRNAPDDARATPVVVVTARQVIDLAQTARAQGQPQAGEQLSLIKEA